jgi:hypothetical protein
LERRSNNRLSQSYANKKRDSVLTESLFLLA